MKEQSVSYLDVDLTGILARACIITSVYAKPFPAQSRIDQSEPISCSILGSDALMPSRSEIWMPQIWISFRSATHRRAISLVYTS